MKLVVLVLTTVALSLGIGVVIRATIVKGNPIEDTYVRVAIGIASVLTIVGNTLDLIISPHYGTAKVSLLWVHSGLALLILVLLFVRRLIFKKVTKETWVLYDSHEGMFIKSYYGGTLTDKLDEAYLFTSANEARSWRQLNGYKEFTPVPLAIFKGEE